MAAAAVSPYGLVLETTIIRVLRDECIRPSDSSQISLYTDTEPHCAQNARSAAQNGYSYASIVTPRPPRRPSLVLLVVVVVDGRLPGHRRGGCVRWCCRRQVRLAAEFRGVHPGSRPRAGHGVHAARGVCSVDAQSKQQRRMNESVKQTRIALEI